jgi:FAD/FMN-containing dehydrogenase
MTAFVQSTKFRSWGGTVRPVHSLARPGTKSELLPLLTAAQAAGKPILAVGLGRSYGDSCLNSNGALMVMTNLRRILHFDCAAGILHAEAGLSLHELARFTLTHGFLLPVLPGTQYVTLGGVIANDVHGKNHEAAGTVGCHVRRLELLRSDGSLLKLSPGDPLFAATVGGLGLTGVITSAEIQLQQISTSDMDVEDIAFAGLGAFYAIHQTSSAAFPYTAAWMDCTRSGTLRGIYTRGRHSAEGPLERPGKKGTWSVPIEPPWSLLTSSSTRILNAAHYAAHKWKTGIRRVHVSSFLHPLDRIPEWNRLYGRRGLYQYQLVVPAAHATAAIAECFRQIEKTDERPSLAVLKAFGPRRSPGLLSFPMEGLTLALDFANKGDPTLTLFERLDALVREAKGRLYLAKDSRMSGPMIRSTYPQIEAFGEHIDPAFCSDLWKRAMA